MEKNNQVVDLAREDDPRLKSMMELLWTDIDPQGHLVEHRVNNREAGPSNQLAVEVNDPAMLSRLFYRPEEANIQACVEPLSDISAYAAFAATLMISIFRPESTGQDGTGG